MDLYPEMATFRDIVFYFKAMMVPSSDGLPDRGVGARRRQALVGVEEGRRRRRVRRQGLRRHAPLRRLARRRRRRRRAAVEAGVLHKLFGKAPKPRLPPSAADASALIGSPVASEDDVLHVRHLPDFDGSLFRASDAEMLLQTLLVPYLRVPLLLHFFAQPSHTPALARKQQQQVLDAAFEPGAWPPCRAHPAAAPDPGGGGRATTWRRPSACSVRSSRISPVLLLASLQSLLDNALDLDAGRYTGGGSSEVILYALRLALRVEQYARFLLSTRRRAVHGFESTTHVRRELVESARGAARHGAP